MNPAEAATEAAIDERKAKMSRMIGFTTTIVAAIMATGCMLELPSSAGENAVGLDRQHASEALVSTLEPANVLIFGDQSLHINTLRVHLQQVGHTVTLLPGFSLPSTLEELAQFQTVWHVGRNAPLTEAQQALLVEYLAIGGAIHLTGEGEGSDSLNDSLTTFVRSVVDRGNRIELGKPIDVPGPGNSTLYPVEEDAPGDVANAPNTVSNLEMLGVGGIAGLRASSPNVLVTGGLHRKRAVGAIWDSEDLEVGAGKLSLIMDADWLIASNGDNLALLLNLQEYLIGNPVIE